MKSRLRRLSVRRARRLGAVTLAPRAARSRADAVEDGVINACRHKSGYLLVPSAGKTCKKTEQALAWSIKGSGRACRAPVRRARPEPPGRPRETRARRARRDLQGLALPALPARAEGSSRSSP